MGAMFLVAVLVAVVAGAVVALVLARQQRDQARTLVAELRRETEAQRDTTLRGAIDTVVALATERLGAQAAATAGELDSKKGLIDQQLAAMTGELAKVASLVKELEHDRAAKFGELTSQIRATGEQTGKLAETTAQLRQALSSTKARGQWGERMAEDVLRLAGFIENVNYRKQRAIEGTRGMPDFTFLLPRDLQLHMDVKFPLDNYLRFLDAESELERERFRGAFLRDVRQRVKELASRPYLDGSGGCVDCLLLFIPNEQLYAFIQEQDAALLDEALRHKVVFCSPLTLFAVLAVVRQSIDNFMLERTSDQILTLLGDFSRQWEKFVDQMDKLGKRIGTAQQDFDQLMGTRRRMLERPLERIEELRLRRDLPAGDALPPLAALEHVS